MAPHFSEPASPFLRMGEEMNPWPHMRRAPLCRHNRFLRFALLMSFTKPFLAILLCFAITVPVFAQTQGLTQEDGHGFIYSLTRNYRAREVGRVSRSEEHTSELQSLRHLVCRLLL